MSLLSHGQEIVLNHHLCDYIEDEETFYEEIKEKSEFEEWREEDNARRYREYQSERGSIY